MRVTFTADALGQLARLPREIQNRILRIAQRLSAWPNVSGARALSGSLAGRFRIRTGDYRVQFFINGDEVVIEKVGHRGGFYDD